MDLDIIDDDVLNEFCDGFMESSQNVEKKPELQPNSEHLNILLKYFGHKSFRPLQWEIISAIIHNRRDVCAVMSTGYGKSLCYQFPSTFLGGTTLVVSPLIALMEDQVLSLQVSNIPACLLGSAQSNQRQVIEDILENKYSIVYLTPEFCCGDCGKGLLKQMANKISVVLIAIDEAHCISSWGHDFRFQYRNLKILRDIFANVPLMAVTATATPRVREDVINNLNLRNPLVVCSGFDRPNIYLEVNSKSSFGMYKDLTKTMTYENSTYKFSGPTIIYCNTRKDTDEYTKILQHSGIKCLPYHAGMPLSARKETHELFVKDKVDVIVATIAFGMGIDKPDIRNVIHYGCSKSIENYYQEVGRAGRDGLPARCVTFYNRSDFVIHRHLNSLTSGNEELKEAGLKKMEDFLATFKCRRQYILDYFGDSVDFEEKPRSDCCDNCIKKLSDSRTNEQKYEGIDQEGCYDFTEDARLFLKVISLFSGRSYGISTYLSFVKGRSASKFSESDRKDPLYGRGKTQSEEWWRAIAKLLIQEGYLSEQFKKTNKGFSYTTVVLTIKGRKMISSDDKLLLPPPSTVLRLLKSKPSDEPVWLSTRPTNLTQPTTSTQITQEISETQAEIDERMALYHKLLNHRTELALQLDCMPYMVASNAALMTMSKLKPKTLEELRSLNLDGFAEAKVIKFGEQFLKIITGNVEEDPPEDKKLPIKDILAKYPLPQVSTALTAHVSCTMMQSGLSLGEIAEKRGISPRTVAAHIISGMKSGHPMKMIELDVTEESRDSVIKVFRKFCKTGFKTVSLKSIKEECPLEITYDHIGAVVAYLQVRYHLQNLNIPYEEFEDFSFDDVKMEDVPQTVSSSNVFDDDFENELTQNWDDLFEKDSQSSQSKVEVESVESPLKKLKTDLDLFAQNKTEYDDILDSPPRQFQTEVTTEADETDRNVVEGSENNDNKKEIKSKKKALPPWLVRKKI